MNGKKLFSSLLACLSYAWLLILLSYLGRNLRVIAHFRSSGVVNAPEKFNDFGGGERHRF